MSRAFAVDLYLYRSAEETYRGREGAIYIPTKLVGIVEGVFGLDNRRMARPSLVRSPSLQPEDSTVVTFTPPQVAQRYNFPPKNDWHGSRLTAGLLEFGGNYNESDLQSYFSSLGQAVPNISSVYCGQHSRTGCTASTVVDSPCRF